MIGFYEQEKAKLQSAQSGLNEILLEVGAAIVDDGTAIVASLDLALGIYNNYFFTDYTESLRLLKSEVQQLTKVACGPNCIWRDDIRDKNIMRS